MGQSFLATVGVMLAKIFSSNLLCQQVFPLRKEVRHEHKLKMENNLIVSVGKRTSHFNRQYYKYYNRVISGSRLEKAAGL